MLGVLRTYRAYRRAISVIAVLLVVGAVFETVALLLLVPIATAVATGNDQLNRTVLGITLEADAVTLVYVAIGAVVAGVAARLLTVYLQTRLTVAVERDQRARIYDGFLYSTWETQSSEPPGRFQWASNLSASYANLLTTILNSLKFVINLLTMLVAAVLVSPTGALTILAIALLLYLALQPLLLAAKRANRRMLRAQKAQNVATAEVVPLAGQIKAYGVTDRFVHRLMLRTRGVLKEKRVAALLAGVIPVIYQATALLIALGILAYATVQPVDVPALGAVALLLLRSLASAQGIQSALVRYAELRPALDNLEEWNAVYAASRETPGSRSIDVVDAVHFDNVTFEYTAGAAAVDGLTLSLQPGDDLGVVGPSGAGKSTVAQLLLRFRHASRGNYLVNNVDSREISAADFAREVAYVPQTPLILRGTVGENITMYREEISDQDVRAAANHAGLGAWIATLPDGFDTVIGPDTHGFSGGQAQRLSIARALAGKPSLVVLDEPTSALDVDSEELVTAALQGLPEHVIVVLIAHRMSTLRHCNRILVLEDGRMTASGSADEILRDNAFFQRAVASGAFSTADA